MPFDWPLSTWGVRSLVDVITGELRALPENPGHASVFCSSPHVLQGRKQTETKTDVVYCLMTVNTSLGFFLNATFVLPFTRLKEDSAALFHFLKKGNLKQSKRKVCESRNIHQIIHNRHISVLLNFMSSYPCTWLLSVLIWIRTSLYRER